MHPLASLSSFLLLLACQQTQPAAKERAPLDLDKVIAALEPKETPPAPPAIPDDLGRWARRVLGNQLDEDDGPVMSARGEQLENLQLAMAVAYFVVPDDIGDDVPAPAREALKHIPVSARRALSLGACCTVERIAKRRDEDILTREIPEVLRQYASEPQLRLRAVNLLRMRPPEAIVGSVMLKTQELLAPVFGRRNVVEDALRRRGSYAIASDYLALTAARAADFDLPWAREALNRARNAPRSKDVQQREATLEILEWSERLDAVDDRLLHADGREGQIARLSWLYSFDSPEAAALAAPLVAEDLDHAMPFVVMAMDALGKGHLEEAEVLLKRASGKPGAGVDFVLAKLSAATLAIGRRAPADDAALLQQMDEARARILPDLDRAMAAVSGARAELYRLMRTTAWPPALPDCLAPMLDKLVELRRKFPDSIDVEYAVLIAAMVSEDRAAALRIASQPLPESLARHPELAWQRMAVMAALEMLQDTPYDAELSNPLFLELARTQGCQYDARLLNCARFWWEAHRPGASPELKQEARATLGEHAPPLGMPRRWLWMCARAVVGDDPKTAMDRLKQARLQAPDVEGLAGAFVPVVLTLQKPDLSRETLARLQKSYGNLTKDRDGTLAVPLLAALAAAEERLGDTKAAAEHSKTAIALLQTDPKQLPIDRGVTITGECDFGLRPDGYHLGLAIGFWLTPPGPDLQALRRMANR